MLLETKKITSRSPSLSPPVAWLPADSLRVWVDLLLTVPSHPLPHLSFYPH